MKLLTPYAAAIKLKVNEGTLRDWRCKDKGPAYVKICGSIMYDIADLERYVESKKIQTRESGQWKLN